mmetsp:Transcript_34583/g.79066  ORF Transcript_34583/g.79066 Transcript_34583/m.79066 type:complete len:113 (+) Transcript_34583:32-370(+)
MSLAGYNALQLQSKFLKLCELSNWTLPSDSICALRQLCQATTCPTEGCRDPSQGPRAIQDSKCWKRKRPQTSMSVVTSRVPSNPEFLSIANISAKLSQLARESKSVVFNTPT